VVKIKAGGAAGAKRSGATSARAGVAAKPDLAAMAVTLGVVAAGVALFEVALIPGLALGGAAVLAPKYLPTLRRRLRPILNATMSRRAGPAAARGDRTKSAPPLPTFAGFAVKQAVAKTITFRIIVTTLDFTTNYLVIGEFNTAAGLSAFGLVVGPVFYFVHEAAWNYLGPPVKQGDSLWGTTVELPASYGGLTINRALAKTVTFRTIASTIDFTANYVATGELATAALLSAFAFVLGPFVYFGHEMAWDYYGARAADAGAAAVPAKLLPAPA
jgi:uncharacterized membrane protein